MIAIRFADLGWPIVSPLISWWTGHWTNHCDLMTRYGMISAIPVKGVVEWPRVALPARRFEVVDLPATAGQAAAAIAFARDHLGKPYDYGAIVSFPWGAPWHDTDRWMCSELTAAALHHAGIIAVPGHFRRVSPADLYRLVKALTPVRVPVPPLDP